MEGVSSVGGFVTGEIVIAVAFQELFSLSCFIPYVFRFGLDSQKDHTDQTL